MNWISGIQRAIDYMEAHIMEEIDYKHAAKEACSSEFHFQRVFSILCGYTPGDYVRMRRLSDKFPYGIGVEYDGRPVSHEGLKIAEIPAYTYAVFTCKGSMPDAFAKTYQKIVTEFFPQNDRYEYGQGIELEVYPSEEVDDPGYSCEIWIAVKEKKCILFEKK